MSIDNEAALIYHLVTNAGETEAHEVAVSLSDIGWSSSMWGNVASIIARRSNAGLPYGVSHVISDMEESMAKAFTDGLRSTPEGVKPKVLFNTLKRAYAVRLARRALSSALESFDLDTTPATVMADLARCIAIAGDNRFELFTLKRSLETSLTQPLVPLERSVNRVCFGLEALDREIRANAGRLGVVAAFNSSGKSSMTLQAAVMTARRGDKALVVSLEMGPEEVHARALACVTGLGAWDITTAAVDRRLYPEWAYQTAENVHTMHPGTGVEWPNLEAAIRNADREHNYSVIVIDYFQLVNPPETAMSKHGTNAQAMGEISKSAKRLAQQLGCCVILVSQFNRETTQGVEPKIDTLRDTGQLENDTDWAMLMWEPKGDAPENMRRIAIRVAKNRGGKRGGLFHAFFEPASNRFVEAST